jgi:hypothetical protein
MKKRIYFAVVVILSLSLVRVASASDDFMGPGLKAFTAVDKGDTAELKALFANPAEINTAVTYDKTNPNTYTPLQYVAKTYKQTDPKVRIEMARTLLDAGADINIGNNNKQTALMIAVSEGHVELVEFLISRKANVTQTDVYGDTALHYTLFKQTFTPSIVDILLANGADPMAMDTKLGNPYAKRILFALDRVDGDRKRKEQLEKMLLSCARHISKHSPNKLMKKVGEGFGAGKSFLMVIAEYSYYISAETLEIILADAVKGDTNFALQSTGGKTAIDLLTPIRNAWELVFSMQPARSSYDALLVNETKIHLLLAYDLFKKYNAQAKHPYKNADKVIAEKMKKN